MAAILLSLHSNLSANDIFVSPNGDDSNLGTETAPLKSLKAARNHARKIKGDKKTILLRAGVYRLNQTLELSEEDSGSVYKAFPGEDVSLVGGARIPTDACQKVTDRAILARLPKESVGKVFEINLAGHAIDYSGDFGPRGFRRPYIPASVELFIDDEEMSLARWPDKGEKSIKIGKIINKGSVPRKGDYSNKGAIFQFSVDRPARWTKAKDIWISGLFNFGYADDTVKIKSIDLKKKTISTVHSHIYGFNNKKKWNTWFAINLLEEISKPGEYYVDAKAQKLYFYPPKKSNPSSRIFVSSLKTPMVAMEGAANIHFEGITFEATRGMGIYIEGGQDNRIKGCTLRNIGMVAISVGQGIEAYPLGKQDGCGNKADGKKGKPVSRELGSWHEYIYKYPVFDRKGGKGHGIVSCNIYNIGSGGIHLGGGNRKTLEAAGNFVRNCHIYKFNRLDRSYKGAVNLDGVGNRVEYCKIHDGPALGIYLHGNNHITEYNEIHDVMLDGDDMGGWYMGRDPSEFGNIIRYNYLHHIGRTPLTHSTFGIYYDDMACGTKAYGNVFYEVAKRSTFIIGGGKYNEVTNNIFIKCPTAVEVGNRGQTWAKGNIKRGGLFEQRTLKHVNITKPPYSTQYPTLVPYWKDKPGIPWNSIERNLVVQCERLTNAKPQWGPVKNNWETKDDPGFVDMKNGNFALKKDSKVFKAIKGFESVPFEKMGLYKDEFRK